MPAVIAKIFYPTAELAIPVGIPTNELNEENKTQSVISKAKISDYSM